MTNDGWGSKWPVTARAGWPKNDPENTIEEVSGITPEMLGLKFDAAKEDWHLIGLDIGIGDRTVLTTFENDGIKHKIISQAELKIQGSNLVDDQQHLYFQCESCNDILDPHTKSFAKLQEHRVNAGWKCVWNLTGMGYKVYCAKCGEKV